MYYETLIPNIREHYFKNKSTIVFIFDINKPLDYDNFKLIFEDKKAKEIITKINEMVLTKKININNAISFDVDDINKNITFVPINPINEKINSIIINQVNSIIERVQRHKEYYDFKDIYFHREGYACLDNSILQTRLMEQFNLDVIFFSLKITNTEPLLENTLNLISPILDNEINKLDNEINNITENDLQNMIIKNGIQISVKEKMFIQEIYIIQNWLKYKEKYENFYRFKKI